MATGELHLQISETPAHILLTTSQTNLNFDSFVECIIKVKIIQLNNSKWSDSICSCSWYMKNYFCYHLIALAVNEGLVEIPNEYKNIAIGAKPKRGRKKKAIIGGKKRQPADKD